MTPQEKAEELYEKYDALFTAPWKKHISTKQCALIAVDEILSAIGFSVMDEYWQEVKEEIEKL
jgi:hypothetical protein